MGYPGSNSLPRQKWRRRRNLLAGRAVVEGAGNNDGVVLSLDMVGAGVYQVAYTVPIQVGTNEQNLSLQVDTGSSDLWIASTSCSSSDCSLTNGRVYDPTSSSTATDESFTINYLQGKVSGPIVWDTVQIGGYSIDNQALAAAENVEAEPLAHNFNGILGLALPLNSIIAQTIPPVTSNHPDGASFSSNLFGITPLSQAPSSHFFSLVLARPGSDRLPSLLGIGHHPSNIVPDPSKIEYSPLVTDNSGILFWKTDVRAITVYVDGKPRPVGLSHGVKGTPYPTAVLDSGVPLILTTSNIANGIYGALGIGPASDGQYYMPCTTPLNMTITFDQGEISLHPLDLTSQPPDNPKSENCIGLIQTVDSTLLDPTSKIGDMILGVPFMRNTYTVMAYEPPDDDGSFEDDTSSGSIRPRLGLLGLTDPTTALQEFNTVRVLNEPLPPTTSNGPSGANEPTSGKKMSIGINVLIGLVGFFSACVVLFVLWWLFIKRKAARAEAGSGEEKMASFVPYRRARGQSNPSLGDPPSISTLRSSRADDIKKKDMAELGYNEFGRRSSAPRERSHDVNDPWDPRNYSMAFRDSIYEPETFPASHSPEPPAEVVTRPDHQRTTSELRNSPQSVMVPLLARSHRESPSDDLTEFGLYDTHSMAGVGTAARGSKIDADFRHNRMGSAGSAGSNVTAGSSPSQRLSLLPRPPPIYPPSTETDVGHEF